MRAACALLLCRLAFFNGPALDGLMQKAGLMRLLPKSLRQMHNMLPPLERHYGRLPEVSAGGGKKARAGGSISGCAATPSFHRPILPTARVPATQWLRSMDSQATRLLRRSALFTPPEQPAQQFAKANLAVFDVGSSEVDAIIVNAAAVWRSTQGVWHLLHASPEEEAGKKLAAKVRR